MNRALSPETAALQRAKQGALFADAALGVRALPVIGEQKDINYYGSVARGVLNGDTDVRSFLGRSMGTGRRVGILIRQRYALMSSICLTALTSDSSVVGRFGLPSGGWENYLRSSADVARPRAIGRTILQAEALGLERSAHACGQAQALDHSISRLGVQ